MNLNLGFLASGNGSNVNAILENIESDFLDAKAKVIVTNNPKSGIWEVAKQRGIPCYCFNAKRTGEFDSLGPAIINVLKNYDVNLIVLAGYMKKIEGGVLKVYNNRILNIHPALLPEYGGRGMYGAYVHEAVLRSNDSISGATVHLVNENYDTGRILGQKRVQRFANDNVKSLSSRVLEAEHILYSKVLKDINLDLINLDK